MTDSDAHDLTPAEVIDNAADLADAVVKAFIDGDAATRQHIVDTLGERGRRS